MSDLLALKNAMIANGPILPANKTDTQNAALRAVDSIMKSAFSNPEDQMGVLIMALVLAARRLLVAHSITTRAPRMRIIKEAVRQFDTKLREYVKQ